MLVHFSEMHEDNGLDKIQGLGRRITDRTQSVVDDGDSNMLRRF